MIRRPLRDPARLTLVVSGMFGLWAGSAHAEWQWAVEFAQVGAGLVHQAPDNPFLVLHAKLWDRIALERPHTVGASCGGRSRSTARVECAERCWIRPAQCYCSLSWPLSFVPAALFWIGRSRPVRSSFPPWLSLFSSSCHEVRS
jgi:hypothetical protein